ncbi:MAG: hypothetical protein M3Z39_04120 [Lactobacillus apis]|nr:hypothetical protein [Lactobacillus apis]
MKFKKLLMGLSLIAALAAGGCSKQKKQSEPILTKSQVIKCSQKSFKSGQAKQVVTLGTDTSKQIVTTTALFGGNPTVFQLNYQTQAKGKTQSSQEWVDNSNHVYINGSSDWYKADFNKLTGHSYADLLDSIINNSMLMDPPKALTNAYKMTRKGHTYTLKANITDQKTMKDALDPIFTTNTQSPKQKTIYHKLVKMGKIKGMTAKLVVKNKKMYSFQYLVKIRVNKLMQFSAGQSYGNMGSKDFLKIPTNALNAKPLPKTNKKKK